VVVAAANVNWFGAATLLALKRSGLEYLLLGEAQAQEIRRDSRRPALTDAGPRVEEAPPPTPAVRARQAPAKEAPAKEAPEKDAPETVWPAEWRERLQKTRFAPVVWTYWELGRDLCGESDPKRRELFQDILGDLAHPPGTHSFWPAALPVHEGGGERRLQANAPLFWEGVRLLRGRAVVIMGEQALRALALPDRMQDLPIQQLRHKGRLLIVLPSPGALIQEPRRMQALREFLRQALAPFL
jgi:hypothetical protein